MPPGVATRAICTSGLDRPGSGRTVVSPTPVSMSETTVRPFNRGPFANGCFTNGRHLTGVGADPTARSSVGQGCCPNRFDNRSSFRSSLGFAISWKPVTDGGSGNARPSRPPSRYAGNSRAGGGAVAQRGEAADEGLGCSRHEPGVEHAGRSDGCSSRPARGALAGEGGGAPGASDGRAGSRCGECPGGWAEGDLAFLRGRSGSTPLEEWEGLLRRFAVIPISGMTVGNLFEISKDDTHRT
jgi:hypothetical protein